MNKAQRNRLVLVAAVLLAAGVFARQVTLRGGGPTSPAHRGPSIVPQPVPVAWDQLSSALLAARQALADSAEGEAGPKAKSFLPLSGQAAVLSLSRAQAPALVAWGHGDTLSEAARRAALELRARATQEEILKGILKLDAGVWQGAEERFDEEGRSTAEKRLDGIWLPGPSLLLLPDEILSRRLVDNEGDLQSGRLRRYLEEGGRSRLTLKGNPTKSGFPYRRLRFQAVAEGPQGQLLPLYRGNPESPEITPPALLEAARSGGDYLLRHHHPEGTFDYSYETKRDLNNSGYNLLRHAGTCYALAELYLATGDRRYLEASRLGLEALLTRTRPPKPEHRDAAFEAVISPGEEAKLGGAALAVLALMRYQEASGDDSWLGRARKLALFLAFQQEPSGHFFSKYFYGPPDPEPFESIYYPGEAILSLLRLYRVDPDPRWLATARRGADWLMDVRDAGKETHDLPHDHWLLMGLNELHQVTGDPRYGLHGARIAQAIVEAQRTEGPPRDWIGSFYTPPRSTPTATRAEALVAMVHLAHRLEMDSAPYRQALLRMASFQLRCQLTPVNSLYLPRPDLAVGGFRRSLTNWEVRIDYVQHNLSALLGLRAILMEEDSRKPQGAGEETEPAEGPG